MSAGRVIAVVLGLLCIILALIYLVSPEMIGGPIEQGELMPQAGMSGDAVSLNFTKIPLGIGELVVPIFSAVLIFGILGVALLVAGLIPRSEEGAN